MIDTTIRFNDHNSFKVTSNLLCYPFGVEGMDYITHSFQVYSTSMLASATRAKTKFLDANGATISYVSHAFAVTTVFGKVEITVAVPSTAVQAQLVLIQNGTNWWLAEPKSEQGQVATPYNVNYAGQLTYITPNGLYTGMVTANQIVVTGSVSQPDETLKTRLVTINNNAINLSSTVASLSSDVSNHESRVTTIEAGQITLSSRVGAVEPKVTKITSSGIYTGEIVATQITSGTINANRIAVKSITGAMLADGTVSDIKIATGISATKVTTGTLDASKVNVTNLNASNITTGSISGTRLANGTVSDVKISSLNGSKITANSITADKINVTNLTVSKLMGAGSSTDYAQFYTPATFSSALQFVTNDSDGLKERLNIRASKSGVMIASNNSGYLWLMNGNTSLYLGGSVAYIQSGSTFLFVESSGVYKEINGVRTKL